MKIDLHCHTKAVKDGDGSGRNVTPDVFREKIINAGVKIVAVTNHNYFDAKQFGELSKIVEGVCQVWPGVEIDVLEPGSTKWHLIVIVNPKETSAFAESVQNLFCGKNIKQCTCTLDEIYDVFKNHDAIYIAHFHKSPSVPDADAEKLDRLVRERHRVFKETTNENSMGVFANYRYNVLVGSDVKNWNDYEKSSFSELKLPVDSFEQFCLLSKRDVNVVQTLLNKRECKWLKAKPGGKDAIELQIYADMNVIFGQKGTGKTQIIKSLRTSMEEKGLECVCYIAAERSEEFSALLSMENVSSSPSKLGLKDYREEFELFSIWKDMSPTLLDNYINWIKTEGNNANKKRMCITNAAKLRNYENEKWKLHKSDKEAIDSACDNLAQIDMKFYIDEESGQHLIDSIAELKSAIYRERLSDLTNQFAVELTNKCIERIKHYADKSTNSMSKPSTTGFTEMVESRIQLRKALSAVLDAFSKNEQNQYDEIGNLDEKGKIYINTKWRMLCKDSGRTEFSVPIRKLKQIHKQLDDIKENVFSCSLSEKMVELNELLRETGVKDISAFVGKLKQTVDKDYEPYEPSNGEKGILLLQRAIKQKADAYFLDEPELGMGNSYIDANIRPLLIELANQHKYVIVATHNANIAVRTLPYMSIYRTQEHKEYKTYVGNPFSDMLVNQLDEKDFLSWSVESMKSLEGSKDAFYERKTIYESSHT